MAYPRAHQVAPAAPLVPPTFGGTLSASGTPCYPSDDAEAVRALVEAFDRVPLAVEVVAARVEPADGGRRAVEPGGRAPRRGAHRGRARAARAGAHARAPHRLFPCLVLGSLALVACGGVETQPTGTSSGTGGATSTTTGTGGTGGVGGSGTGGEAQGTGGQAPTVDSIAIYPGPDIFCNDSCFLMPAGIERHFACGQKSINIGILATRERRRCVRHVDSRAPS